jgi:hypothetical protein
MKNIEKYKGEKKKSMKDNGLMMKEYKKLKKLKDKKNEEKILMKKK